MLFEAREIEAARALRAAGLEWEPAPGHYVYDEDELIEQDSPFQEHVYFILELRHFVRRAGSIDGVKQHFTWLPTWHDCRDLLRRFGVADATLRDTLCESGLLERGDELLALYRLIGECLSRDAALGASDAADGSATP